MSKQAQQHIPDSPFPTRGTADQRLHALQQLADPLQDVAHDVAALMEKHHLEAADITLQGEVSGNIHLTNTAHSGVSLALSGAIGQSASIPTGTPYIAHYNGEFFWRPSPDSDDFVKSGDTVRTGQLIGWAMGESKDMSFGLRADQDGVIQLVAPNATKVVQGKTVLYYIQEQR